MCCNDLTSKNVTTRATHRPLVVLVGEGRCSTLQCEVYVVLDCHFPPSGKVWSISGQRRYVLLCRRSLVAVARGSHEQWKLQWALAALPEEKGREGKS